MPLKPHLGITQTQRLGLSPMMRQSLALLRMPTATLQDELAREAEENPFLAVEPAIGSGKSYDLALTTTASNESLGDSLVGQITIQRLDSTTRAAALFLIGELREDGYLDTPLSELADARNLPIDALERGLATLQCCDPVGIGARSLVEFLALKLIDAGITPELAHECVDHLGDFAENRWARLGKALDQDRATLERIASLLRSFPAAPVQSGTDWVATLIPELSIQRTENNRLSVKLIESSLPQISVLTVRRADLSEPGLRTYLDRAQRINSGFSARLETLLRVGRYIAAAQSAFFLGGHMTITPITRADAATALAMHPSTLGRAIAGKALLADGRLYPLATFFAEALAGPDGGVSPFDIQLRIRRMISKESADAPRSDESICAELMHEGVDIARRTVAKYRKCMRIPSSFARRRRKVQTRDPANGQSSIQ
ncbi:MAG: RNA polymerase sigma-54 factor [Albidovulum sp.]